MGCEVSGERIRDGDGTDEKTIRNIIIQLILFKFGESEKSGATRFWDEK
jgi:hypothetical protein